MCSGESLRSKQKLVGSSRHFQLTTNKCFHCVMYVCVISVTFDPELS